MRFWKEWITYIMVFCFLRSIVKCMYNDCIAMKLWVAHRSCFLIMALTFALALKHPPIYWLSLKLLYVMYRFNDYHLVWTKKMLKAHPPTEHNAPIVNCSKFFQYYHVCRDVVHSSCRRYKKKENLIVNANK